MVLPLEPFPQRVSREPPVTAIERKETAVLAFEKDSAVGEVIWDIAQPPAERVNQAIRDVLVRKPAQFYDVTIQDVEREDAEQKAKHDGVQGGQGNPPQEDGEEEAGVSSDGMINVNGKMMTIQEMGQMKVVLHQTLGVAWNELNKIAELCRSLISSQPHPYVLPPNEATASIPAKSLTGTVADRPPPTQAVRLLADTKLAVVRHIDAIKRAHDVLSTGSKQLRALTGEEEVYWSNVLRIGGFSRGRDTPGDKKDDDVESEPASGSTAEAMISWSLLPRPLSNGVQPTRQIATDIMIPYAPDEASPPFRALAMATMVQQDLTSPKQSPADSENEISYRARRHKRLRICFKSNSGDQTYSRVTGLADPGVREGTNNDIGRAQAEMFDDEVFEMVDTDDVFEEQKSGSVTISTQANLLAALLRLGMFKTYRTRRLPSGEPKSPPDRLLAPVVAYMHYQAFCQHLLRILEGFQIAMRAAGFEFDINKNTGGPTGGLDWAGLIDDGSVPDGSKGRSGLKGNVELLVNKRAFCTILLSTDAHLTIVFSHTTFNSQDIAQLPLFLSQELRREIITLIVDDLKANSESVRFHADEIAGVVKTKRTKLEVAFTTTEGSPRLWAQASTIAAENLDIEKEQHSAKRIIVEPYSGEMSLIDWARAKL